MAGENGVEPRKGVRGLGSLEAQLMETLWASPAQLSVQEVCDRLGADHNYKTVMTVLNRLVEKELLGRELDGRAYKYKPRRTRDQFLESVADELVQGYLVSYGPTSARHLSTAVSAVAPLTARAASPTPAPSSASHNHSHTRVHISEDAAVKLAPLAALLAVAIVLQLIILLRGRR